MPTQTAKDPSAREKIIAVLKDWRVLAGEVLAVGGTPTRVGYRVSDDGIKTRISRKSGGEL